jgi:hypothetical protein
MITEGVMRVITQRKASADSLVALIAVALFVTSCIPACRACFTWW